MTSSNDRSFDQWEQLAEAVVFAHDPAVPATRDDRAVSDFERTAAIATAAMVTAAPDVAEPVPEPLFARLSATGLQHCADRARERAGSERHRPRILPQPTTTTPAVADRGKGAGSLAMFFVGIAATALVWLGIHLAGDKGDRGPSTTRPAVEQRAELLRLPTTRSLAWSRGPSALSGQVEGDVVWNDEQQEGYLTFRGLPPLDRQHRFQLWIVDQTRPESAPVDGGLFDIQNASTTATVRIAAKLPIGQAAAFVITVEDKAGAVVSKQEHVVATAGL